MREIRQSGSEGGVALTPPSLPLSNASRHSVPSLEQVCRSFTGGRVHVLLLNGL